jgi:SAM-dependent methyltransferase
MAKAPGDVIALPVADGKWVVMNVFARTALGLEAAGLEALSGTAPAGTFPVWEIEWFANREGLLADPTRFRRDPARWPAPERLDGPALVERLQKHKLLIEDEAAYRAYFGPKTSLIDGQHFGNFHQQLGQELMLSLRVNPNQWWLKQKFEDDMLSVRNTLYKAIQETYLRAYFPRRFAAGQKVIDVGCGTGFYSNLMAAGGASVLGVDPNPSFIEIARKNAAPGVSYEVLQISAAGAMDQIPSASADFVFMSDALLFYFVPATPTQVANIDVLFADIRRILKPNGRFISVEPHPVFWLSPWLGDPDRPFTVLTEYCERKFSVTGNTTQFVQACARNGFAVTWMDELRADPGYAATDARATHFAREFPLWQLFELAPLRS